jgi:hypothetical protein
LSLLLLSIKDSLLLLSVANINFQQLCVFAMDDKASPTSVNTSNKCGYLFPFFPSLERQLAGEQTILRKSFLNTTFSDQTYQ